MVRTTHHVSILARSLKTPGAPLFTWSEVPDVVNYLRGKARGSGSESGEKENRVMQARKQQGVALLLAASMLFLVAKLEAGWRQSQASPSRSSQSDNTGGKVDPKINAQFLNANVKEFV